MSINLLFSGLFDACDVPGPSTLVPSKEKLKSKKSKPKKKSKKKKPSVMPSSGSSSSETSDSEDDDEESKPFLLRNDRSLNSLDKTALNNLYTEFLALPKYLSKVPREGGSGFKDYFKKLKGLVEQVKLIKRDLKGEQKAKQVRSGLKLAITWFTVSIFEEFSFDESTSGFIDCLRNEVREKSPIFLFGARSIRKMRTQLKSFAQQNRTMKSASPATIFAWQSRKRTFGSSGYVRDYPFAGKGSGPDKKKDARFSGYQKK